MGIWNPEKMIKVLKQKALESAYMKRQIVDYWMKINSDGRTKFKR